MIKTKKKYKLITDAIYSQDLYMIWGDKQEAIKTIHELGKDQLSKKDIDVFNLKDVGGLYARNKEGTFRFIYVGDDTTVFTVIAHELIHHVTNVFDKVGIPMNDQNTEVFAYYFNYILDKIVTNLVKLADKEEILVAFSYEKDD